MSILRTLSCTAIICAGNVFGAALSEQDAIIAALKENTQIRIMQIDLKSDALKRQAEQSVWYPGISLSATGSYDPLPAVAGIDAAEAKATQIVPGGGVLSASAGTFYRYDFSNNNYTHKNDYTLTASQPILAGAWSNAEADVALRLQRIDHRTFTLQQRNALAGSLSDIRSLYWNSYVKMRQVGIAQNSLNYTQEQAARVRARYSIGTVSAIDTMSAALELLKARSLLLDARIAWTQARDTLGRALGYAPADTVVLPDSLDISISELPLADSFIAAVKEWDPQREIFTLMAEKLEIQLSQQRNAMLPSLVARADYTIDQSYLSQTSTSTYSDNAVVKLIFGYALPFTSKRVAAEQTRLSQQKNLLSQKNYEAHLASAVHELVNTWNREKEKLAISIMTRDLVQIQLAATVKGYELGTVDRLALIKAQDDYVSESLKCLQQQIALKNLEIVFDEITGTVLKKFGVQLP